MRMSNVIVNPIASPAIDLKAPPRIGGRREDDPDEEEGEDRLGEHGGAEVDGVVDLGHAAVEVRLGRGR